MNESQYKLKAQEYLHQYEDFLLHNLDYSLNFGYTGLLLFYGHNFFLTRKESDFKKIKHLIGDINKNLGSLTRQPSFFTNSLGYLWTVYLIEKSLNIEILNQESKNLLLEKTFEENLKNTLDYIYGIGGWFVIYPYLDDKWKARINDLFLKEVRKIHKNEFPQLKKIIKTQMGVELQDMENYLGFSHGISSVIYILNSFYKDEGVVADNLTGFIEKSFSDQGVPRTNEAPLDYLRQSWCHGGVGVAFGLSTSHDDKLQMVSKLLEQYSRNQDDFKHHGVCHGIGQKILLKNIGNKIFLNKEFQFNIDYSLVSFDKFKASGFINSPLVTTMAMNTNEENYLKFPWWRMFYPARL